MDGNSMFTKEEGERLNNMMRMDNVFNTERYYSKPVINLNRINDVNDFDTKRIQSFFYWWACEEFYTYREVINNEVYTSIISPLEGYPIYNGAQFV